MSEVNLESNLHKDIYKYRMFDSTYPSEGDIVMARVASISDNGADCELLEYACISAYLSPSEYSKKKVKNMRKFLRVGKLEPLQVIKVDEERNYIDLSKKYLTSGDVDQCNDRFQKNKFVQSLFCRIAEVQRQPLSRLLCNVVWPLNETEKGAYDIFQECTKRQQILSDLKYFKNYEYSEEVTNNTELDNENFPNFTRKEFDDVQKELKKTLDHKLRPKEQTIEALIQVNCFSHHGVDAIKEALVAGKNCGTKEYPLVVVTSADGSKSAGTYAIRTKTYDEKEAVEIINSAIKKIKKVISQYDQSTFNVYKVPKVV